jgi:hypothetical protein
MPEVGINHNCLVYIYSQPEVDKYGMFNDVPILSNGFQEKSIFYSRVTLLHEHVYNFINMYSLPLHIQYIYNMYPISFYIYIYILYIYTIHLYLHIQYYIYIYMYIYICNISYFYVNDILYPPGPSLEVTYSTSR